ncbi:uncharacterized protein LOC141707362 [Apium graveolens]|uniref:uncharacterized protein LOC141707362 n=1 Tax=Apium graveolens TaxID=4045 RepID=UPI003D7BBA34
MISVLNQERFLGAALGAIFTGAVVFEQRRRIYKSIAENEAQFASHPQIKEPVFEKKSRLEFGHLWNRAVDLTFGTLIESLSSRGK